MSTTVVDSATVGKRDGAPPGGEAPAGRPGLRFFHMSGSAGARRVGLIGPDDRDV